jgi:2'-5' RNA ligase
MAGMYFIALVAPGDINGQVLKWKNFMKERYDCVVALRSPAHITIIPPFWMEDPLEEILKTDLDSFSSGQEPFQIELKDFGAFKPRVIFVDLLPNPSLHSLQSALQEFLTGRNRYPFKRGDRPFHPHLTIATRDLHKKAFHEAWAVFKEKEYEAAWQVKGISLLRHNQKNWDVVFTSQFKN